MANLKNNININDLDENQTQESYNSFKEKLESVEKFPSIYTFKFIVKTDTDKPAQVKAIFQHPSANFSQKSSTGGKYISITIKCYVNNADEVIDYYKKVSEIPGVMML